MVSHSGAKEDSTASGHLPSDVVVPVTDEIRLRFIYIDAAIPQTAGALGRCALSVAAPVVIDGDRYMLYSLQDGELRDAVFVDQRPRRPESKIL